MGEMTTRWAAMLVGLGLVAALVLAVLVRSPLSQNGVGTELVGTWQPVRIHSESPFGPHILKLDSDQQYTMNGPMLDVQGTWEVGRPGWLRLDNRYGHVEVCRLSEYAGDLQRSGGWPHAIPCGETRLSSGGGEGAVLHADPSGERDESVRVCGQRGCRRAGRGGGSQAA